MINTDITQQYGSLIFFSYIPFCSPKIFTSEVPKFFCFMIYFESEIIWEREGGYVRKKSLFWIIQLIRKIVNHFRWMSSDFTRRDREKWPEQLFSGEY